jgi:hypothetical protein
VFEQVIVALRTDAAASPPDPDGNRVELRA